MNMYTLQTSEFGQYKMNIPYACIVIYNFALYMHTCTVCMHVCTCVCDCSDYLIMALQELKDRSFNNIDYWEQCLYKKKKNNEFAILRPLK